MGSPFLLRFITRMRLIMLAAVIGMGLIARCLIMYPLPTQVAELPSPALTLIPSLQPTAIPSPPLTFTPFPQLVVTPTPSPILASGVKLLASISISTFDPHDHPAKKLYSLDWSPDGKSIAYGWEDGIWIVREPTYEPTLLVSIPRGRRMNDVMWSPSGQYLAFHGDQFLEELWGEFIWVVKSDGTGLKNLTTSPPFDPLHSMAINQWVDDHVLTIDLWLGTGTQSLWKVDITSGKATQLIGRGDSMIPIRAHGGSYNWSPTYKHIVINHLSYHHLVVVDVAQADEIWFSTMESPPSEVFRGWSKDGQRFLYSRKEEEGYSLWLWDVARGKGEKLLPYVYQAALSPDGSRVAFLRQETRSGKIPTRVEGKVSLDVWPPALTLGILDVETGEAIICGPAGYKADEGPYHWEGGQPVWSPNGEFIAYWGEEGDVWVVSADGQWRQRLTQYMEIVQVIWSPDGEKLALRSLDQAWIIEKP